MEFVPVLVLGALVLKFTDFLKLVSAKDWNAVTTQLTAWGSGIVGVLLVAQTDFASAVPVGEDTLATLNGWSLIVAGLSLASTASVGYDVKRAIDNNDSAKMPPLTGTGGDA